MRKLITLGLGIPASLSAQSQAPETPQTKPNPFCYKGSFDDLRAQLAFGEFLTEQSQKDFRGNQDIYTDISDDEVRFEGKTAAEIENLMGRASNQELRNALQWIHTYHYGSSAYAPTAEAVVGIEAAKILADRYPDMNKAEREATLKALEASAKGDFGRAALEKQPSEKIVKKWAEGRAALGDVLAKIKKYDKVIAGTIPNQETVTYQVYQGTKSYTQEILPAKRRVSFDYNAYYGGVFGYQGITFHGTPYYSLQDLSKGLHQFSILNAPDYADSRKTMFVLENIASRVVGLQNDQSPEADQVRKEVGDSILLHLERVSLAHPGALYAMPDDVRHHNYARSLRILAMLNRDIPQDLTPDQKRKFEAVAQEVKGAFVERLEDDVPTTVKGWKKLDHEDLIKARGELSNMAFVMTYLRRQNLATASDLIPYSQQAINLSKATSEKVLAYNQEEIKRSGGMSSSYWLPAERKSVLTQDPLEAAWRTTGYQTRDLERNLMNHMFEFSGPVPMIEHAQNKKVDSVELPPVNAFVKTEKE